MNLFLPIYTSANSELDVDIDIVGNNPNVQVGVDGDNAEVDVTTGEESDIGVITGKKSNVYINGEGLNSLRPQYYIKKITYNDDWMEEALAQLDGNMEGLANALALLKQDVSYLDSAYAYNLAALRAELYAEINRLHFGRKTVYTIISSEEFKVDDAVIKFNNLTARRINDYTTLIALRLLENLGVNFLYDKIDDIGMITLLYKDKAVVLKEGSKDILILDSFGREIAQLKNAPVFYNNRIYLPTREISRYLGFDVTWNPEDDSITIKHLPEDYPDIKFFINAYQKAFEEAIESSEEPVASDS